MPKSFTGRTHTSKTATEFAIVEIVQGVEGPCVVINDRRVAGPKPWGGGTVIMRWETTKDRIKESLGAGDAAVEILAASFPSPMTSRDTEILAKFREKVTALESDATFWREMFVRAKCGCFAKDCAKHGAYDPNAVTKASLILRYS